MKSKLILCLALVLSGGLFGCSTTNQQLGWPVFYDSEKGPEHLSISHESKSLDSYTNEIPEWNADLRVPPAKINSAAIRELGEAGGLRVVEAHLFLADTYYSDAVIILQEGQPNLFLPVYVQNYNQETRMPSANKVTKQKARIMIEAGMDYSGTGHFHNHYQIVISPNQKPVVTGSFY